jgi:hypothetical protein
MVVCGCGLAHTELEKQCSNSMPTLLFKYSPLGEIVKNS